MKVIKVDTINYNSFKMVGFSTMPNYSIDIYVSDVIERYNIYKNAIIIGIMEMVVGSLCLGRILNGNFQVQLPPDIVERDNLEHGYVACNFYIDNNNNYTKISDSVINYF